MKKTVLILISGLYSLLSLSQIPNPGFENWTNDTLVIPSGWLSYGKTTQITPGSDGDYAIQIQRDPSRYTEPGAILYGYPVGDIFTGGIPFADRPDSLVIHAKYDIAPDDSAWVLIMFKKDGVYISQDTFFITGAYTSDFRRLAYEVNYLTADVPDSLIIGFTSSNPANFSGDGYLIIDDVYFTNTLLSIPNSSFESWNVAVLEEPDGWNTDNRSLAGNPQLPVTATSDSYSGDHAIRIQNVAVQNGITPGYAITGPQGDSGPLPGFPVSERDTLLSGYFKFFPENNDTCNFGVIMYSGGTMIGSGFFTTSLLTDTYTQFIIHINYNQPPEIIPDSATILLIPFQGSLSALGESVLFVDELRFNDSSGSALPDTAGTIAGDAEVCQGQENVTYSVAEIDGASSYVWTLPYGITGTSLTNSIDVNFAVDAQSGDIEVNGLNEYGRGESSSISVVVNEIPATPVIRISNTNDSLLSNAMTGNQWYHVFGILEGENHPYLIPEESDAYFVVVTINGCVSDTSNKINFVLSGTTDLLTTSGISVYPNPANSQLIVSFEEPVANCRIQLYNNTGALLLQTEAGNNTVHSLTLDISDFTQGIYMMKIYANDGVYSHMIIIK